MAEVGLNFFLNALFSLHSEYSISGFILIEIHKIQRILGYVVFHIISTENAVFPTSTLLGLDSEVAKLNLLHFYLFPLT